MPKLRPFQQDLYNGVLTEYQRGAKVVMPVLPTGGGKTVIISEVVKAFQAPAVAIAHRKELVSQISVALARNSIRHRVIGDTKLARRIAALHIAETGRDYTNRSSPVAVVGVDTLINMPTTDPWFQSVRLWVQDEGHHVLKENKWGTAASMFPNAVGLAPTATPIRADKKGLGSHADGLVDAMVLGPSMRDLINAGYLTDYRVFAPPSDVDYSQVPIGASGDLSAPKLRAAVHKSTRIVGDVVQHYLRIAKGKLGVTFAVDVEAAREIADAFRQAGVPAEVVSAETPDQIRAEILRKFARREILQLVNVDLFGEGFDLPALEVVSMVRKTESFSLYCQQFGRALRLMIPAELQAVWGDFTDEQRLAHIAASSKPHAVIIDHVGNVLRHGLPDARQEWTLDRGERRRSSRAVDVEAVRTCDNLECLAVYPRMNLACPYCGTPPTIANRSAPEYVDGDLHELDPSALAKMRGEIERIDGAPTYPFGASKVIQTAVWNRHKERQDTQKTLRSAIALLGGYWTERGESVREFQKRFYLTFGTDVMSAQALNASDADALHSKVLAQIIELGIVERKAP